MNIKLINNFFKLAIIVGVFHSPFAQSAGSTLNDELVSNSPSVAQHENGFIKVGYRSRGFHNRGSYRRFWHRRAFSRFGHRSFRRSHRKNFGSYGRYYSKFGNRSYRQYGYRRHF